MKFKIISEEIKSILKQIIYKFYIIISTIGNNGIPILEENWDNLIILDCCRYDAFRIVYEKMNIKGRLEYRISKGTNTESFLLGNFPFKYDNIVYVTGNPCVTRVLRGKVYKIINVWKRMPHPHPSLVYEAALLALKKYPSKKLIIHFVQPHGPYSDGIGEFKLVHGKIKCKVDEKTLVDWPYIGCKVIDVSNLIRGYVRDLKLVMFYVKKLIDFLPGRTVVTADHGEAFGEKFGPLGLLRIYGHPAGIRIEPLVKVPWLVIEPKEKAEHVNLDKELIKICILNLKLLGRLEAK